MRFKRIVLTIFFFVPFTKFQALAQSFHISGCDLWTNFRFCCLCLQIDFQISHFTYQKWDFYEMWKRKSISGRDGKFMPNAQSNLMYMNSLTSEQFSTIIHRRECFTDEWIFDGYYSGYDGHYRIQGIFFPHVSSSYNHNLRFSIVRIVILRI